MYKARRDRLQRAELLGIMVGTILAPLSIARAQGPPQGFNPAPQGPWMDTSLSPDQRADLVIGQLTLEEKISLVHGTSTFGSGGAPAPASASRSLGGAGFVAGIPRLGIPDLQMADAAVGVTRGAKYGRYSTVLPSAVSESSSWDPKLAYDYGALIGRELRDQGFNMSLGGGVNLTREPRNGRLFEYQGEDPILAGTMVGQEMKGLQAQGVIGDIKHYALNDQETGRNIGSANIDPRSMRESDLLAFQIGIRDSGAGAVMGSYNRVNGDYSCENDYLLNQVLKKDFGFKGFVLSDWGGTHSTVKAAMNGLDLEMPGGTYFGDALGQAVESGQVPMARLDDMLHRILRTEFAVGLFDTPPDRKVVDVFAGFDLAQRVEEEGAVLLKNADRQLPLSPSRIRSIAVIGSHADVGVLSGGGSAQVDPPGGNAVPPPPRATSNRRGGIFGFGSPVYDPSSPLKAIRAKAPGTRVTYDPGTDPGAAGALAKESSVAIVFVTQPASEGRDVPLTPPNNQDQLVAAVASANPHTIVVLETGGPVTMPWIDRVSAVMEAWYPGIRGADTIADLLFGDVNPSGKLTMTFPRSEADLPHPRIAGPPPEPGPGGPGGSGTGGPGAGGPGAGGPRVGGTGGPGAGGRFRRPPEQPFDIDYSEGLKVGYKWYDAEGKDPLFAFGEGLSYTTFAYSGLTVSAEGQKVTATFAVRNTGKRAGEEIAQVYLSLPASTGEPPKRLVAWDKIPLAPGETRTVTLTPESLSLAIFNADKDDWEIVPGDYTVSVGGSSRNLPLKASCHLEAAQGVQ